jgi:predicted 3-demethylubiquinone-9 3-methyltransferase (glyoxalase superfamily)
MLSLARFATRYQPLIHELIMNATSSTTIQTPIQPFFWFERSALEAATFYTGIFPNSRMDPPAVAGVIQFWLNGMPFLAMDNSPQPFASGIALMVECETQAEIDHYWDRLVEGGGQHDRCGWLRDRFGVAWNIVPRMWAQLVNGPDKDRSARAFQAMLTMTKLDIAALEQA